MSLFLIAVLAGVALGRLRGGSLSALQHVPLRLSWLVLPAVAVQLALIFARPVPPEQGGDPLRWCLPATVGLLALFVALNHALPGMRIIFAGLVLNFAVIAANGGLMPTNADAAVRARLITDAAAARAAQGMRLPRSKDVVLPLGETRLWPLSDTLVSPPLPRPKVMSIGDVLIALGLVLTVSGAMLRTLPTRQEPDSRHRDDMGRAVEGARQRRLAHLLTRTAALAPQRVTHSRPQ